MSSRLLKNTLNIKINSDLILSYDFITKHVVTQNVSTNPNL